jgi:MFS transporter, DHA1 family, multidrug resistance protein
MGDAFLYAWLPANYHHIGIPAFWVGVILSVNRFARLFLNGLVAWWLNNRGIKTIIIIAVVLASVTTISYGFFSNVLLWIVVRLLWGISFSALRLSNTLYALQHYRKGIALGLSRAAMELGPVAALVIGPLLLQVAGHNITFLSFGLFSLAGIFIAFLLSDLKFEKASRKDLSLSLPTSFNVLVLINSFISEGVMVVLLGKLLQDNTIGFTGNIFVLTGLLLGYRRLSLVLFSPLSGWLADKWSFEKVFVYTTILSAAGLLFILYGAVVTGIITLFTFSAINASAATGGAIRSGVLLIKEISDNATWRDIGTACGAFTGALLLSFYDLKLIIAIIFLLKVSGLIIYRTKSAKRFTKPASF